MRSAYVMMSRSEAVSERRILSGFRLLFVMDADQFCDRWFGLDILPVSEREKIKKSWGYKSKRVRLLSEILQKPEKTIHNWGSNFENMPNDCKPTLIYADALRIQLKAAPEVLLKILLEEKKNLES